MKKTFLLLFVFVAVSATLLHAQDNWVDVNFTRDSTMWKESFPPLAVSSYSYQCIPVVDNVYNGFKCDGTFGKFAVSNFSYTPFNADDLQKQLIYAFRFTSNSATTNWTFPEVPNVGKIRVNVMCGNVSLAGEFKLQKYVSGTGIDEVWADFDPAVKFIVPAHNNSTTSFIVEQELNLTGPIKLRFLGPAVKNVHMYAVSISKNLNAAVSEEMMSKYKLNLVGRNLKINSEEMNFKAVVYNLSGIQVGTILKGESISLPVAASYIVKIKTSEGLITKKLVVL